MFSLEMVTTQGGVRQLYRTFLEGVWLNDMGRKAEVRNVPHLALQGVSTDVLYILY